MPDLQPCLRADADTTADLAARASGALSPIAKGCGLAVLHGVLLAVIALICGGRPGMGSALLIILLTLAAGLEGALSSPDERDTPAIAIGSALALLFLFCLALAAPDGRGVSPIGGGALMIGGIVLRIAAIRTLGRDFVSTPRATRLARDGPYRWLRHPSESGQLLLGLGAATLTGSVAAAIWWGLIVLPLTIWRLRSEEAVLATLPAYASYRADVPGLVPGLRVIDLWRRRR